MGGCIRPMARTDLGVAGRVVQIVDPGAGHITLSAHQQMHVIIRVVDNRVADARTRREPNEIAGFEIKDMAVDPGLGEPFQHKDEFLLMPFGMGPAGAPSGRQDIHIDADPGHARRAAQIGGLNMLFLGPGILVHRGGQNLRPMTDEAGAMVRHERASVSAWSMAARMKS